MYMQNLLSLKLLLVTLIGCGEGNRQPQTAEQSGDTAARDTVCFRQVVGSDTTTLRLVINGSEVTGELAVLPYEKDRARGPIRGILADNQIRADWQRAGEGVTQSYEMLFTLTGDAVTWKEGERTERQGRWVLAEPEKGYEYKLLKSECR